MISHLGHVMTLANSIIGVGILAMPFCFQKCGIILSILLLILSNWTTRICCHYLIKSSLLTRRKSFEILGFHAFGSSGKLLVELCVIGYLLGTCITYFVVVGDLGPQIIMKMFALTNGHIHLRTWVMLIVTLVCILPLGMLKNVDSLSTVCTASIGFYVCFVIKIILESGEHVITNDWREQVVYWQPAGILQCLPIFSMALSCQMQIFEVFGSINNQSLEKLNGVVRNATWICTFVYIAVGFFGYVAFCTQTFSGNILVNFSPSFGSDVIKIGFVLSVAFSFPLVIFPCRASIYSLLYRKGHMDTTGYIPDSRFKGITVAIVGFALTIALMIPSVELIIGLVGSTIGVAICIMFPAACFRKIVKKDSNERTLAHFLIVAGFCLMILGTYANLSAIDEKRSGAHLAVAEDQLLVDPTMEAILSRDKFESLERKMNNKDNNEKKIQKLIDKPILQNQLEIKKEVSKDNVEEVPVISVIKKDDVAKAELNVANQNVTPDKIAVVSPIPAAEGHKHPAESNKSASMAIVPPSNYDEAKPNGTQGQTIAKDAFKKEDEIAAEESKISKDTKAELESAKKEFNEKQILLERKVDELKEQLAKQNKETQNLVVEKLGEVVEKVEEIERKVQQNEPKIEKDKIENLPQNSKNNVEIDADSLNKEKGSLLNILKKSEGNDEIAIKSQERVYEPLSYKTGELIESVKNGSKLEQRLPLPLALLINASQAKMNEQAQLAADKQAASMKPNSVQETVENPPKKIDSSMKNETSELRPEVEANKNLKDIADKSKISNQPTDPKNEEKENVEAIRREILQVDEKKIQDAATLNVAVSDRVKRSVQLEIPDFETINAKLEQQNLLAEPNLEVLMAQSSGGVSDVKMRGMGRDLKSVEDNENEQK